MWARLNEKGLTWKENTKGNITKKQLKFLQKPFIFTQHLKPIWGNNESASSLAELCSTGLKTPLMQTHWYKSYKANPFCMYMICAET